MQSEILHAFRSCRQNTVKPREGEGTGASSEFPHDARANAESGQDLVPPADPGNTATPSRDVAISFLRLPNLDNDIVDRLSRYEAALWRQLAQTLFTLQALKRADNSIRSSSRGFNSCAPGDRQGATWPGT